jgi:hypothetical protein
MKRTLIRPALVGLAIIGALVVGGIAYANIPDAGGVVHACYKKSSPNQGALRVIDTEKPQTCSNSETQLDWSQTGPQGPQGIQGPSGASHAYSDTKLSALTPISPNSNTITKLALPAGNYVVSATGSVVQSGYFNTAGSNNDVKCSLNDPDDNAVTASEATANDFNNYTDAVPYTLVATMSFSSSGTITVSCTTLTGTVGAELDFNSLVASKVDAVN